ncbi:MAG: tetratricopeptide repeat protein [Gemmatimonadales bacterium]
MSDARLEAIRREVADLEARLAAPAPGSKDELKRRIVAVFKDTESTIGELQGIRDRIKALVDRYKQAGSDDGPPPPQMANGRPQVRSDHLGASTFIDKGWSLISLGDHVGAEQALQRALELSPGDRQALSLLGWAQMLDLKYDEALGTFSRVLAEEPGNALARVNVGYICLRKRIFGEAIEHLSRVIRLDNDRKAVLYANFYLGLVYLEREMYLDAETFLERAIGLGPNLIEAYYELGRAQWFAGNQEGARATWERGAQANKFAPWAKRCRELLESLERGGSVPRSSSAAG